MRMGMAKPRIRAVVYQAEGWWIIHGLDYEFVTLAKRLEDVPHEIQRFLSVLFAASQQIGVEPFHGYKPAPRRVWEMYEGARPWTEPFPPVELPGELGSGPTVDTRLAA
jgi:hypothetical protein